MKREMAGKLKEMRNYKKFKSAAINETPIII
jgi:hypothetical protein